MKIEKAPKQFYVYTHSKPNGTVFYIGKGHGERSHVLNRKHNVHHQLTVAKYGEANVLIKVYPCVSEAAAFALEIWMIKIQRDKGVKLCNRTDGGEGVVGHIMSDATRAKMREAHARMTAVQRKAATLRLTHDGQVTKRNWTTAQKKAFSDKQSEGTRASYERMTKEAKIQRNRKIADTYANYTEEQKEAYSARLITCQAQRTPESKAACIAARRVIAKAVYATFSQEKREAINEKRRTTMLATIAAKRRAAAS